MGTWGSQPWESDDAADWFAKTFEGIDLDARVEQALKYDDRYGEIRAAAYLLRVLGHSPQVWPGKPDRLQEHVASAVKRLRAMAAPDGEYLKLWQDDPQVAEALAGEIAATEALKR
jgi:hypothetical protein